MAQQIKHRVQMALEVTRGTAVTPMTLEVPIVGDGFRVTLVNAQGQIMGSQTFPYLTDSVPVGFYCSGLSLRVEVNRDTIRDMLLLATKRTAGVLPAVTIVHDQQGVGVARYAGCVCTAMNLEYSRTGTPGGENLLVMNMEFACMSAVNGAGAIAALTPASARRFQIRQGTHTINSVAAVDLFSLRIGVANRLALGPVSAANVRSYIEDGEEANEISCVQRFSTTAWRLLCENSTEFAASFVIATGTANETVTASVAKAQAETRNLGENDGTVTEEVNLNGFYGVAAPVVWTFGSAIGASVLGL